MRSQLVLCSMLWMFYLMTNRSHSQEKNTNESQSSSTSETAEDSRKAAGQALLQSELKKNQAKFFETKQSSISVEKAKLSSLEGIKRNYLKELMTSERKSRSFGMGLGGAMESSNRAGIQAAIQLVDQDIEKAKKASKVAEENSENEQVVAAWGRMRYHLTNAHLAASHKRPENSQSRGDSEHSKLGCHQHQKFVRNRSWFRHRRCLHLAW